MTTLKFSVSGREGTEELRVLGDDEVLLASQKLGRSFQSISVEVPLDTERIVFLVTLDEKASAAVSIEHGEVVFGDINILTAASLSFFTHQGTQMYETDRLRTQRIVSGYMEWSGLYNLDTRHGAKLLAKTRNKKKGGLELWGKFGDEAYLAVKANDIPTLQKLEVIHPLSAWLDFQYAGQNLLHVAGVGQSNRATVRFLVGLGLDVNESDEDNHFTPLHMACRFASTGASVTVEALLENGADISAQDKSGRVGRDVVGEVWTSEKEEVLQVLDSKAKELQAQVVEDEEWPVQAQQEKYADVMISLHCASMGATAELFKEAVRERGYSTWICLDVTRGANFRNDIAVASSKSQSVVCFINESWAKSAECQFEFNIAIRKFLTKGKPLILPIIIGDFDPEEYPHVDAVLCNTNAVFLKDPKDPTACFESLIDAMSHAFKPSNSASPKAGSRSPMSFAAASRVVALRPPPAAPAPESNARLEEVRKWSTAQVWRYLIQQLGPRFEQYKAAFEEADVDGYIVFDLDAQDLPALQITNSVHRKKLFKRIGELAKECGV